MIFIIYINLIISSLQFMEVVERIGGGQMTQDELYELFNITGQSNYIVVYLRLITSGKLQRDADFYLNFIDGNRTMTAFCHQVIICFTASLC